MRHVLACLDRAPWEWPWGLLDTRWRADYGSLPRWKAQTGDDGAQHNNSRVKGSKDDTARALGEMPRLPLKVGTHGYLS